MAKIQNATIPKTSQDVETQNPHSLLVGVPNSTATMEEILEVSYKIKHTLFC